MPICSITPSELLSLEAELCKELVLKINRFPGGKFALLQAKAAELQRFARKPHDQPLKLIMCFEVNDPKNPDTSWWAHLGVKIGQDGGDQSATYMMAIGTKAEIFGAVDQTLCKVHWDYEFVASPEGEKKPERHMQFGGRISDELKASGYTPFWQKDLDKPRIPNYPICLVTLLHWTFLEFAHCDHIKTVLGEAWWTKLVRQAEEKTLRPYFEGALSFFRNTADREMSFLSRGYH